MLKRLLPCLALAWGLLAVVGAAQAQTNDYFIFSDVPDDAWVVRGGAIQRTFPHAVNDLAIAVGPTIRALQWDLNGNGSEYDLVGNIINPNLYPPIPGFCCQALDGTTDGTSHNFVGEWLGNGDVWQTDRNWANGQVLFTVNNNIVGITYDPTNTSLWLTINGTGDTRNYDLQGNLLSSFSAGPGRWGSLAWEPATDTLWMINNNTSEMRQFSKTGQLLLSQNVTNFGNVWGGEFQMQRIPAPASIVLLTLSGLGLIWYGRRGRAAKA